MERISLFAASLTLVLAACTPAATTPETTVTTSSSTTTVEEATTTTVPPVVTTTTEVPDGFGGEVTIGVDLAPGTLNPFAPNAFDVRAVGNLVWATVYDIDPETWERVPDVVETMPSKSGELFVNDDGTMSVTYRIINEATWSDGEPITGFDLAFTAAVMRDMALAGEGNVDPVMATITGTEGDGKSATINFSEPTLAFEDALWIILPSHALEGVDLINGTDGTDWPSGGPFVVDVFNRFRDITFARNDRYWKTDGSGRSLPYLDEVRVTKAANPGTQTEEPTSPMALFFAKAVDVALVPQTPGDFAALETITDEGADVQRVLTPIIEHLTFNFSDAQLDSNSASVNELIEFRRALATSINRPSLLDEAGVPWLPEIPGILLPVGESAWSVYEAGIAQVPEVPEGAASILSTTGNAGERPKIAEALAPAFTAAGVDYEVSLVDSQEFFQKTIVDGTYEVGMWAWISDGGYASRLRLLETFDPGVSPPDGNFGNWGSGGTANEATDRFSEIVDEAKATADPVEFFDLVREAESILATELPLIPLFSRGSALAVWPDAVAGLTHNGSTSTFTWNVESWQRPGE